MNKHLAGLCHVALWAFLFLSPLTYWRGTGIKFVQYLMYCMQPAMLMLVFYLNYLYLAPKLFVAGKHRYDLLINLVLITALGLFLHYWNDYTNELYGIHERFDDAINDVTNIMRDSLNLAIFAGGSTALALARKWVTTEQKLRESETARIQSELKNLRSQINPHFLLNTLNNIYALTAIDQTRAQNAIQQLSKMLRHLLYDNQEREVTLTDEMQFIENYIALMKIRLSQNVDVTFHRQVALPGIKVAPLIFISLIENAFKHGVSPVEPSFVHISITATEHDITCQIENSNHPKSRDDRSGHGIGLSQVQRRLELSYPGRYTWEKGVNKEGNIYTSTIHIQL
ncbi:MAG: histidine kinase [Prevotella sp.]|nr:histidine kinase [Prevotella sp.]